LLLEKDVQLLKELGEYNLAITNPQTTEIDLDKNVTSQLVIKQRTGHWYSSNTLTFSWFIDDKPERRSQAMLHAKPCYRPSFQLIKQVTGETCTINATQTDNCISTYSLSRFIVK